MNPRADKSKCKGRGCGYKQSCGRYLRPSADRQIWTDFDLKATDDCGHFEPVVGQPRYVKEVVK